MNKPISLTKLFADPTRNRCQICNHPMDKPRDLRAGTHWRCSHAVPTTYICNPDIEVHGNIRA